MAKTPKQVVDAFKKTGARVETKGRVKMKTKDDFALYYTPGVGAASLHLAKHPKDTRLMSVKKNSVAVISDGSAVLGLGNIGPYGALPVMEGKALIFRELAGIDAWPIVLDTQDPDEIVRVIKAIAPGWGGINLEDFKAPECFDIEKRLIEALDIPVMHDDQHGTAIVVLAGLINAMQVVGKKWNGARITISGVGAAGVAIIRLLKLYQPKVNILAVDSRGIIGKRRKDLNATKQALIDEGLIFADEEGDLRKALIESDVFIGVSGPSLLKAEDVKFMNEKAIVFALSNPMPEILPEEAKKGGAMVIATGRSDFPNQINNALVFPGVFRGALDKGVTRITDASKLRAAKALAALVAKPTPAKIIPDILDKRVVKAVAGAVRK
ncbi:MAG: NADP-dependent malic enzyme [Patescibacteria group bacterium]